MAQQAPNSVDFEDIQFKLHDKFPIFKAGSEYRNHVNLLAVASSYGLLFAGNANAPEFKVTFHKDLVDAKITGRKLRARTVPLPNIPNALACSADGSMLAVNYTQGGSGFLQIYSVQSFTTPQIKSLFQIRLSPEENVFALQLLWNPVLTSSIAIVLSNGSLALFSLKDNGQFEMHSLDKSQQVKCGCWSPKGKQIVLGFPLGKLQQFKPDLTPAKTITCPPGLLPGAFDTIALHWLSTFQFATVFLQQGADMSPSLYIINAPKGGTTSYINYSDICYSGNGPRAHQFVFTHIQQWNLLLVSSANGVEVGILGTRESGETPTWLQYTLLDEARIEMPLTDSKDETYPVGFVFDTASVHQLTIAEKLIPAMPMLHVLSTHGHLVCFNFINLTAGAVSVCSPPPPISDTSGQFHEIEQVATAELETNVASTPAAQSAAGDMSFAFTPTVVTSTPAVKDKPTPLFGAFAAPAAAPPSFATPSFAQPSSGSIFSAQATAKPPGATNVVSAFSLPSNPTPATTSTTPFGDLGAVASNAGTGFAGFGSLATTAPVTGTSTFGGFGAKPVETVVSTVAHQVTAASNNQKTNNDLNKPLYTVPPTYTPPTVAASQQQQQKVHSTHSANAAAASKPLMNLGEVDEIVKQMIVVQINSFDLELKQLANQSKGLLANIGNPVEMKNCTKRLNDLQEIIEQANDRDFESDVQNLRHSLNESYAMLAECRSKLNMYNNPDITRLASISTFDPINRRQLAKLQSYLATNQAQMQQLQQQIDAQWSCYQDLVRRNSKSQMHIPCLEGIYQRMTKLKDLLSRQRIKLNYIKSKLKEKGLIYKPSANDLDSPAASIKAENTMESLADSILSMSLIHVVDASRSKLSDDKLNAIRNFTRQLQTITIIKPQRPDRVGLKSEVILETKLQSERKAREGAANNLTKMQQQKVATVAGTNDTLPTAQTHAPLAKPTATKPAIVAVQAQTSFAPPAQTPTAMLPNFGFGGASSFVKTVAAAKSDEAPKSFTSSSFATPTFTGFGGAAASGPLLNFGQAKPATSKPESLKEALSTPPIQTPVSFSPKVIGGNGNKSGPTAANNTTTNTSGFAALSANSNATVSMSISAPVDKENKKPDDTPKPATIPSSVPSFGGFGNISTTTNTKPSIFDGKSVLPPSNGNSAFSFGGLGASLGAAGNTSTSTFTGFGGNAANANAAASSAATVSFNTSVTAGTAKAPLFSGFGKPVGEVTASSALSAPAMAATVITTTAVTKAASSTMAVTKPSTTAATTLQSTTIDSSDSLFSTLNICKPNTKENATDVITTASQPVNLFAAFGGNSAFSFAPAGVAAGDASKTTMAAAANKTFLPTPTSGFGKPLASTVAVTPATTTITAAAPIPSSVGITTPASPATTTTTAVPSVIAVTTNPPLPTFGTDATVATVAATTTSAILTGSTTSTTTSSIFGGSASFLTPGATTTTSTAAPSIFSAAAVTTATAAPSPFGVVSTSATTTTTATSDGSIFGAAGNAAVAPVASTNVFGGIPKPDQSVFGSPATAQPVATSGGGLFAAAAAANPLPFGSPATAASGGSIFGGTHNTGFPTGGSIFGGAAVASPSSPFGAVAATGGSIFGGAAAKPAEGGNLFASPTQTAASGGSIFGQNNFGQSSGSNIFGAASAAAQQPASGSAFGATGGSIFGGAANTATSGGSIFGGSSANAPAFGTPTGGGFGAFSQPTAAPAFGSPNNTSGSFAQGGVSVAQSGFGSPQQQQQQASAFAKPTFGGAPAFGSPPAFGAQPAFGSAPTFGSPKPAFGAFSSFGAAPNATAPQAGGGGAFGSPTQKNNLFEALGSTDSGLSFGNLAQPNANAQKPSFGGSSFMNYRA